jgi:hypothetical protein
LTRDRWLWLPYPLAVFALPLLRLLPGSIFVLSTCWPTLFFVYLYQQASRTKTDPPTAIPSPAVCSRHAFSVAPVVQEVVVARGHAKWTTSLEDCQSKGKWSPSKKKFWPLSPKRPGDIDQPLTGQPVASTSGTSGVSCFGSSQPAPEDEIDPDTSGSSSVIEPDMIPFDPLANKPDKLVDADWKIETRSTGAVLHLSAGDRMVKTLRLVDYACEALDTDLCTNSVELKGRRADTRIDYLVFVNLSKRQKFLDAVALHTQSAASTQLASPCSVSHDPLCTINAPIGLAFRAAVGPTGLKAECLRMAAEILQGFSWMGISPIVRDIEADNGVPVVERIDRGFIRSRSSVQLKVAYEGTLTVHCDLVGPYLLKAGIFGKISLKVRLERFQAICVAQFKRDPQRDGKRQLCLRCAALQCA